MIVDPEHFDIDAFLASKPGGLVRYYTGSPNEFAQHIAAAESRHVLYSCVPDYEAARWQEKPLSKANCKNCGAPQSIDDGQCSYCLTVFK